MFSRILLYLGLLGVGMLLSYKGLIKKKLFDKISNVQLFFLFVLIFIMGIRVGMDKDIVNSISEIGIKSFIFALLTVIFSIVFVFLVSRFIIKDKTIEGDNPLD